MATDKKLGYKITADNSGFKKAMKENVESTKKLDDSISGIKNALLGLASISLGFEFLKDSLKAFAEAETSANNLRRAISANGGLAGDLADLNEQSEKLARIGIFDKKSTEAAQAMGLQMGLTFKQIETSIPLLEDWAAATHGQEKGVETASEAMGHLRKAMTGNDKLLKGLGFEYDKNKTKAQNFGLVMQILNKQFKDANEDIANNTTAGQMARMTNAWEELKIEVGEGVAKAFQIASSYIFQVIDKLRSWVEWMKHNKETVKEWVNIIKNLGIAFGIAYSITKAVQAFKSLQLILGELRLAYEAAALGRAALTTAEEVGTAAAGAEGLAEGLAGKGVGAAGVTSVWSTIGTAIGSAAASGLLLAAGTIGAAMFVGYLAESGHSVVSNEQFILNRQNAKINDKDTPADLREHLLQSQYKWSPSTATQPKILARKLENKNNELPAKKETPKENITLNITKLVETLEVHSTTLKEGTQEIKEIIGQVLQEAVYSVKYAGHQ